MKALHEGHLIFLGLGIWRITSQFKGILLEGLVKEVASRLGDPVCIVKCVMQHGLASSWSSIAS